jgi:hypothetical protein
MPLGLASAAQSGTSSCDYHVWLIGIHWRACDGRAESLYDQRVWRFGWAVVGRQPPCGVQPRQTQAALWVTTGHQYSTKRACAQQQGPHPCISGASNSAGGVTAQASVQP